MLPPLKIIQAGLRRTTEALAIELASAGMGSATPNWDILEWQLALAVAAAHGVSPLLFKTCTWKNARWQEFLRDQHEHVTQRHGRISELLKRIDTESSTAGLPIVPLKGAALHALNVYLPGERPMADIDLLVAETDVRLASTLLQKLGYVHSFVNSRHHVFTPLAGRVETALGEHRDNQIRIELHTRIKEELPVAAVDITSRIYPNKSRPGLNPHPSSGALMSHLLLHTAGNIRCRSARLLHLNDIARLAGCMTASDWDTVCNERRGNSSWWALPPLRLTARYYCNAIPPTVLTRLDSASPALLKLFSHHQTLTRASCSGLWIQAFSGIEWSRSFGEAYVYLKNRLMPREEANRDRTFAAATHPWLTGQRWATLSRGRQILVWLARRVPRLDTLYVVSAALARGAGSQ